METKLTVFYTRRSVLSSCRLANLVSALSKWVQLCIDAQKTDAQLNPNRRVLSKQLYTFLTLSKWSNKTLNIFQ